MTTQEAITLAGTLIAFILAIIRVIEFFQDRKPKLKVTSSLNSLPEIGNTIILLNQSKIPANIYYYSLVWFGHGPFNWLGPRFRKPVLDETPDYVMEDGCNVTVPAHAQASILFIDDDHFEWGSSLKYDIYLKLWMIGHRSPKYFFIVGPKGK